jgi:hypothetical protein
VMLLLNILNSKLDSFRIQSIYSGDWLGEQMEMMNKSQ